jgi:hypothetical protein
LGVDVVAAAEVDDVPHHQEVAREVQLLDHRQLILDLGVSVRVVGARAVAAGRACPGQVPQIGDLGVPVRERERR